MNSRIIACGLYAAEPVSPGDRGTDAPPRIHSRSRHHRFALLVLAGYPYDEACLLLNISPRTAERWRTNLRTVASRHFRRRVTYEFAARYALDAGLRQQANRTTQTTV